MNINVLSSITSAIASSWGIKRFLGWVDRQRKSGHSTIPKVPTQTASREYKYYNMLMPASSKDNIESWIYSWEVPESSDVYALEPHDIATREIITPKSEDSIVFKYFFGAITRHGHPATENASPSSTEERPRDETLERRITTLFMTSGEEEFESGMISDFSRDLCSIIDNYGKAAIEIISYLFLYKEVNSEVQCETLRWLGRIDQVDSRSYRLWLLEKSLESPSRMIRDAAILGIAAIDDPWAIPVVRKAMEKENCRELRDDMEAVLKQLEEST